MAQAAAERVVHLKADILILTPHLNKQSHEDSQDKRMALRASSGSPLSTNAKKLSRFSRRGRKIGTDMTQKMMRSDGGR